MDSGFRRNDEMRGFRRNEKRKDRNWIPTSAGMTPKDEASAGNDSVDASAGTKK
jgi:hypothetical protein